MYNLKNEIIEDTRKNIYSIAYCVLFKVYFSIDI